MFGGSEDIILTIEIVTNILNLRCDLDIEDSEPIFLHDTSPHDIHHNTKFGKKWLSASGNTELTQSDTWRKYHLYEHSLTF